MDDTEKLIKMLESPKASTRYDACESLRVAPSLNDAAIAALERASNDSDPEVRDAAQRALSLHKSTTPPLDDTQEEDVGKTPKQSNLLVEWIGATTIGWSVIGMLISFVMVSGLEGISSRSSGRVDFSDLTEAVSVAIYIVVPGILSGAMQSLVLRIRSVQAGNWVVVSALAWILAGALGSFSYHLFDLSMSPFSDSLQYVVSAFLALGVAGAMVGAMQWLVLQDHVSGGVGWVFASTVGWGLGLWLVIMGVQGADSHAEFLPCCLPPVTGLLGGAVTGASLVRRLRHPARRDLAAHPRSKRRMTLAVAVVWSLLMITVMVSLWQLAGPIGLSGQSRLPKGCPPACQFADLRAANLARVYLREADLSQADLAGANLAKATLSRANLAGADLNGADLTSTGMWDTDLSGANLSGANLSQARLEDANLSGADLTDADLRQARLWKTDLSGADLRGADLTGADLSDAILEDADLTGASLSGVFLGGSRINQGTKFEGKWQLVWEILNQGKSNRALPGVDLSGTDLRQSNLSEADLSAANLSGARLWEVDLRGANLTGADLSEADLAYADLSVAALRGADLTGADLEEVNLTGADLTDALVTSKQLAKAASLKGATLPDGTVHE